MKLKIVILVSLTVIFSDNWAMLTQPEKLFLWRPDEQQERIQQEAGGVQLDMNFQQYRMLEIRKNILAKAKLRFRPMK